jgi:DNA-binding winged helix-turn-helix (wHTH) protein
VAVQDKEDGMRYQFGDCEFDGERQVLRRGGAVVHLPPQVLRVLRYLLVHRDRVVAREALLEACWPESYVSDETLSSCLRRVRQAIGQTPRGPVLIATRHRRGYQFVGEVQEVEEPPALVREPPAAAAPRAAPPAALGSVSTPQAASEFPGRGTPPGPLRELAAMAERRHLSVLSCTLADADTVLSHLDPEDRYDLMQRLQALCVELVAPYAGCLAAPFADGVLVYFGYPQAHEDDARRAVRSGLVLRTANYPASLAGYLVGLQAHIPASGTRYIRTGRCT